MKQFFSLIAGCAALAAFDADACSTSSCFGETNSGYWIGQTSPFGLAEEFDPDLLENAEENRPPAVADPVWPALMEFHTSATDHDLGGPFPLRFRRYYATMASGSAGDFYEGSESPMGLNWIHSYMLFARKIDANRALIYYVNGQLLDFQRAGPDPSPFQSIQAIGYMGTPYSLRQSGSKIELIDPVNRVILTFEFDALSDGEVTPIESIRDRNGNTLGFTYDMDGLLEQVADGLGRTLDFGYMDSGGFPRVVSVTDQTGRMTTYGYSGNDLASASDRRGNVTTYGYDTMQFGNPCLPSLVRRAILRSARS